MTVIPPHSDPLNASASDDEFDILIRSIIQHMPFSKALGIEYLGYNDKDVSLKLRYKPDLSGDRDHHIIAGGALSALLDQGCGIAVWRAASGFQSIATLDLRIDYMRAAKPYHDIIMTAHCYKLTHRVGFVRALAYEISPDDPVASAQAAFAITGQNQGRAL